nr:hypothetical protein [uncultured Aminipila sp.]
MNKRIFFMLTFLCFVLGLCACSAKQNEENQNSNSDSSSVTDPTAAALNVSLEEKRIIQDQSFNVELNNWGNVRFISYEPDNSINFEDVSFYLMKDNKLVYSFPYFCENNSTENYVGLFDSVSAVEFCDVNNDYIKDVIVIINYVTGAGPQGMVPRPRARIFLADKKEFYLATDLINDITNNIEEKDLSIATICDYLKNK